jgi:hypothetical protein
MKPDKLSVHDLFQRDRRYVVPLYQRAYVWTQEDQWEPLWDDIERQAENCLDTEAAAAKRSVRQANLERGAAGHMACNRHRLS